MIFANHCVKYAIIWLFSDPCILVEGQNRKCCPYLGVYESEKKERPDIFYALNNIFCTEHFLHKLQLRKSIQEGIQPLKKVKGYDLLIP